MRSFQSNENIRKKEDGSYYIVSANSVLIPEKANIHVLFQIL